MRNPVHTNTQNQKEITKRNNENDNITIPSPNLLPNMEERVNLSEHEFSLA